ncbi:hypothetical protein WKH27_13795, partial [Pantoea agglomerans]
MYNLLIYQQAEQRILKITIGGQRRSRVSGLRGCFFADSAAEMQKCRNAEMQKCRNAEMQKCRNAEMQ